MEDYFSYLLNNFSLEVFLLNLGVFFATMLIKLPVKKATEKLPEAKRQGINSLIILIPLVLSFFASFMYFLCVNREVLSLNYVSFSVSMCVMAIAIYSIYARIVIIIKGILSGKIQVNEQTIENALEQFDKKLQETENLTNKEELQQIKSKISSLLNFKKQLQENGSIQSITAIEETTKEIEKLELQKQQLEKKYN